MQDNGSEGMDPQEHQGDREEERVVETASATNSPDNQNSGPFAYIVTAIALGSMIVVGLLASGCVTAALQIASMSGQFDDGGSGGISLPYDEDTSLEDLEDLINQYTEEFDVPPMGEDSEGGGDAQGGAQGRTDRKGSATVADVLDFSIAPYGDTVNELVGANAYAGVPQDVRDYVRSLLKVDQDYADKVAAKLDAAARNEDERAQDIQDAMALCDEAKKAIESNQVPSVQKDADGAVKDLLGTASSQIARRWEKMKSELQLLDTDEEVRTSRLWDADADVVDATEEAAMGFEDALAEAAEQAKQ